MVTMVTFRQSVPLQYNHLFIMDSSFVNVNQTCYNPTSTIQTTLNYADIGIQIAKQSAFFSKSVRKLVKCGVRVLHAWSAQASHDSFQTFRLTAHAYLSTQKYGLFCCLIGIWQPEKTANILLRQHWFPQKMTSEKWVQKFHTDQCVTTQIWVVLLIGWSKFPLGHDQSEALPKYEKWHIISMEFLPSFYRETSRRRRQRRRRREMSAAFSG